MGVPTAIHGNADLAWCERCIASMSQVRWPPIKPDRGDHDASKGRIRTTGTIPGPSDSLDRQLLKQRLRVLQVARVEPFVEPPVKPEQPVRALAAPCAGHARGARGPIRRAWRPTKSRRWLPIPSQDHRLPAAACLPIPITGIVEIALNAVQVSVNPCAVRAFAVGNNLVRFIPIVFSCPPKPPTQA